MPIDEPALRREGFTEGTEITLGDGQEWTFPRPWIRLFPVLDPATGKTTVSGGKGFGPEHAAKLVRYLDLDADEEGEALERLTLRFEMAAALLLKNYDLSPGDIADLLVLDESRPETCEAWGEIDRVLMGFEAPKPSAAG